MGYSVYFTTTNDRWQGYGVPGICDLPSCLKDIDLGLAYMCDRCELFYCAKHLLFSSEGQQICDSCNDEQAPPSPKPNTDEWVHHVLVHPSWRQWRDDNPSKVEAMSHG